MPATLQHVAALARQLAEACETALWSLPYDKLDAADELEKLAEGARAAAERIG